MNVVRCRNRDDFGVYFRSSTFATRWQLERLLAVMHQGAERFTVPGVCAVCASAVQFAGDFSHAWPSPEGIAIPNWREALRCPQCQLNGRERLMTRKLEDVLHERANDGTFVAYLMEAVSPVFQRLRAAFPEATLIGSEFLGAEHAPGSVVDGIRHEDAERLSLADGTIDLFVSCEVYEHVNEPARAFRELVRVLKPGGRALMTFPMDPNLDANRRRAACTDGRLELLEPALYHGNPLSPDGSLVFTDFGWQVLEDLRAAGLHAPTLDVYWSYELGYLGMQFYFEATKSASSR